LKHYDLAILFKINFLTNNFQSFNKLDCVKVTLDCICIYNDQDNITNSAIAICAQVAQNVKIKNNHLFWSKNIKQYLVNKRLKKNIEFNLRN